MNAKRRRRLIRAANAGSPALDTVGQTLWWARRQAKISQTALAEAIGVSVTSISQWGNDEQNCTAAHWSAALAACGYRVTLEAIE